MSVRGLYPIGEGSGYAGGITSSATDALKAVEAGLSVLGRVNLGAARHEGFNE